MEEVNSWILRIVVDFDAFDGKTANTKPKDIEHQAQQFKERKKKECVHQGWSNGDGDVVPQKIHIEWKH